MWMVYISWNNVYIYNVYHICIYIYCESEVITWILPVPLDYILVEMVDGFAVVSDTTCAPFDRTYAVWGSWAKGALDSIPLAAGGLMLITWDLGVVPAWCPFAPPTSGQLCRSGVRDQSTFQAAIIRCRILQISWGIIQCRRLAKSTYAHAIEINRCLYTIQTLSIVA